MHQNDTTFGKKSTFCQTLQRAVSNYRAQISSGSFLVCYINEFVQELLDNISIFYYDAHLGVNAIMLEPLLAGNK